MKMKLNDIVTVVFDNGDLLIVSQKGHGKTVALFNIARQFRNIPNTRVMIFEDFPKWSIEFDKIPFYIVQDSYVVDSDKTIDISDIWLRHERSYTITKGSEIKQILKTNKDILFLSQIEDIDRQAFFLYSIFNYFYRKQYLRKKKQIQKKEHIIFIIEELQNIADSAVLSRKIFNRFRKKYNVCRNLDMHVVGVTQRFQDLNTKIRGRMLQIIGKVNTDDYELKVRRLLRHSKYRKDILSLDKGTFIFVPNDTKIKFPLFKQKGKPYEIKPIIPQQTKDSELWRQSIPKPKPKHSTLRMLWDLISFKWHPAFNNKSQTRNESDTIQRDDELIEEGQDYNEGEFEGI